MTNHQILQKAREIVAGLIAQHTPDLSETLEAASKAFAEVVAMSKGLEPGQPIPAPFAQSIAGVCDMLDSFRSGYASNDPSQAVAVQTAAETARNAERIGKAMDPANDGNKPAPAVKGVSAEAFAAHVKATVEKALAQKTAERLRTLHALHAAISKALSTVESFAANTSAVSFEETAQFTVVPEIDALQIVPTETAQSAVAAQSAPPAGSNFAAADTNSAGAVAGKATEGNIVSAQSAAPAAGSNFEAVGKSFEDLAAAVEKNSVSSEDLDWPMDMNSKEFRTGRRVVDFGRDRTAPTD